MESSREPSAAAPAREAPHAYADAGGGPAGQFFEALSPVWRLTGRQRARLTPAVAVALSTGWTPHTLAEFTGANTGGVRSPYAVLAARLSPAELPAPPGSRQARPAWCGECDERTRMAGFYGDAPHPCPRCKPPATSSNTAAAHRPGDSPWTVGVAAVGDREHGDDPFLLIDGVQGAVFTSPGG